MWVTDVPTNPGNCKKGNNSASLPRVRRHVTQQCVHFKAFLVSQGDVLPSSPPPSLPSLFFDAVPFSCGTSAHVVPHYTTLLGPSGGGAACRPLYDSSRTPVGHWD